MKALKDYIIPFTGLKLGIHQYEYDVDETFFQAFENSEIERGTVKVILDFERKETMLILTFNFLGEVAVMCDRCCDSMTLEVKGERRMIIKFGESSFEETEEIDVLPESAYKVDVAPYINEFINLLLPIRRVHDEGQCNPEMVDRIENHTVIVEDDDDDEAIDPRWAALKGLK